MQRCINAMCPLGFDLESNEHSHKTKTAEVSSFLGQTSHITKTRLFKYIENFTTKTWKKSDKNSNIFHISAQNIDCGTRYNRLAEAVITCTHNLCFE